MKKRVFIAILLTAGAIAGTYNLWHHSSVLIFISILILSFLLSYKVTDYLANFKTVKHNSRADIAFLIIFFVLLCIPASHISKAEKTKGENRCLAKKTTLIKEHRLNLEYGKEFNEWFNDRFAGRKTYMFSDALIQLILNKSINIPDFVYVKKGPVFIDKNTLPRKLVLQDSETDDVIFNLNKLEDFCNRNNIKLYVLISPTAMVIYNEQCLQYSNEKFLNKYNQQLEYIIKNSKAKIIYPYKEIISAKNNSPQYPLYYKTDNHWTHDGAYIAYKSLMNEIKKDYPDIEITDTKNLHCHYSSKVQSHLISEVYNKGNLYKPFTFCQKLIKYPKVKYHYYDYKPDIKMTIQSSPYYYGCDFTYDAGFNKKVLLIGSSMNTAMIRFLPYSFNNLKHIRLNGPSGLKEDERYKVMKHYGQTILEYKPDIMIYSIAVSNLKKDSVQIFSR